MTFTPAMLVIAVVPRVTTVLVRLPLFHPASTFAVGRHGRHRGVLLAQAPRGKSARELRKELAAMGIDCSNVFEREELERQLAQARIRWPRGHVQADKSIADISSMHLQVAIFKFL